ncbi:MAG: hypothetical protein ACK5BY_01175 [Limnohabitans sp.]|jgi:hypothetical protein|uniref:hypothetical protein n=1 Tax=Limnohabitans sp. TaxID=1907725 RepID=UPI00391A4294
MSQNRQVKIFFPSFIYTIWAHILQGYVIFGDHFKYRLNYDSLADSGVVDGYFLYNSQLGAGEPVYYLLTYLLSNLGVDFEIFNNILTFLLVYLTISVLTRGGLSISLAAIILFPSYYLMVLSIDVIRLKVAIIFFLIALNDSKNYKSIILSILSQFQIIGYYVSWILAAIINKALSNLVKNSWKFTFNLRSALKFFLILSLIIILLNVFLMYLVEKIAHYSDQGSLMSLLQLLVFPLLIGLNFGFFSKKFYFFIPLVVMSFFVGPGRVTIMIYAAFLYMTSKLRFNNFLLLNVPFSVYYLSKTYLYISALIDSGSGFEYMDSI